MTPPGVPNRPLKMSGLITGIPLQCMQKTADSATTHRPTTL